MFDDWANPFVHIFKAGSHFTANLLQPAIDGCVIENFPIFRSNLRRPRPLRQSHRPATSIQKGFVIVVSLQHGYATD